MTSASRDVTGADPLTLPLDLKDADGVLRVERPDLAGGQRVSPLESRGHRGRSLHRFDERLRAHDGHHAACALPPSLLLCQDHTQDGLSLYL